MATKTTKTKTVKAVKEKEKLPANVRRVVLPDWVSKELCKGCVIMTTDVKNLLTNNPNWPEFNKFAYVAAIVDHKDMIECDMKTGKVTVSETLHLMLEGIETDLNLALHPFVLTPANAKNIRVACEQDGEKLFMRTFSLKHYAEAGADLRKAMSDLQMARERMMTFKAMAEASGADVSRVKL